MDPSRQVLSSDGRMEGVQIGNQVVLFGRHGDVDLATPLTYQASGPAHNLLTNLRAGQKVLVMVNGKTLTTVTASAQGTLAFTLPAGGTQTVSVRKAG